MALVCSVRLGFYLLLWYIANGRSGCPCPSVSVRSRSVLTVHVEFKRRKLDDDRASRDSKSQIRMTARLHRASALVERGVVDENGES